QPPCNLSHNAIHEDICREGLRGQELLHQRRVHGSSASGSNTEECLQASPEDRLAVFEEVTYALPHGLTSNEVDDEDGSPNDRRDDEADDAALAALGCWGW